MTLPNFDPVFPAPVIATVAGVSIAFTLYRAFRGRPIRPSWLQGPVVLLRLLVILLLAVILLNPSKRVSIDTRQSSSLILLDRSASMKLSTGEKSTRWTDARGWAVQATREIESKGLPIPAIAVFNEQLENVPDVAGLEKLSPAGNETRLASAVSSVLERNAESAPRQIIVVSDGCAHDRSQLPKALSVASGLGAKISTKLIGTDVPARNTWIAAVQAPRSVRPKGKVSVHIDLAASGVSPFEKTQLILRDETGKEISRTDYSPAAPGEDSTTEKVMNFDIGLRTTHYSLELSPVADEVTTDDNHYTFTVEVSSSKLRVLMVEGTHVKRTVGLTGYYWNDIELMTRAWDATGEIEYEVLTPVSEYNDHPNLVGVTFKNGEMRQDPSRSFPSTREALYRFDVMLISDVPVGNFSDEQMQWVVDWVNERGGGFLMGGGYTTFDVGNYDKTPWERIIPVDMLAYGAGFMEKKFSIRIPDAVKNHPLWHVSDDPAENERALAAHPAFLGMNRVKRAKPGAIVLAVRSDQEGDEPVIAAQSYGRGRSIAWLPDPNGGWARDYVKWGPPGGPPHGPQKELGHGSGFHFDSQSANAGTGPQPPHPSPWYGQYWVNLVKWLGEPSVRWHRDQLAGRARAAAANPGESFPVAAEVLTVTRLDDLLALDVGARLSTPGSPRIRLEYDRDAREFVGEVPIPATETEGEITITFDVAANGAELTDRLPVSLRRTNMEFTETAPDQAFMKELAAAAAGRELDTPQDVADWLSQVEQARAKKSAEAWNQPLWPVWPFLATIIGLLCLEWLIRRRAMVPLAMFAGAFLLLSNSVHAQESQQIDSLIAKLGSPLVRERDEAEETLSHLPEAEGRLRKLVEAGTNEEVRLRARNIVRMLKQSIWSLDNMVRVPSEGAGYLSVLAAPDGASFYSRGNSGVYLWKTPELSFRQIGENPLQNRGGWTAEWPSKVLSLSPDGKQMVTAGQARASFTVRDATTGDEIFGIPSDDENATSCDALWSPNGKLLVTGTVYGNASFYDPTNGNLLGSVDVPSHPLRMAFSKDGRYLLYGIDESGEPDLLWIQRLKDQTWSEKKVIPDRVNAFAFSPDGTRVAAALRNGSFYTWSFRDGKLVDEKLIFQISDTGGSVMFSQDGNSLFVSSASTTEPLYELDAETGEVRWKAPVIPGGCSRFTLVGKDLLVTVGPNLQLSLWRKQK